MAAPLHPLGLWGASCGAACTPLLHSPSNTSLPCDPHPKQVTGCNPLPTHPLALLEAPRGNQGHPPHTPRELPRRQACARSP